MKPVSLISALVVVLVLIGCASQQAASKKDSKRVLLILREYTGSSDTQYMGTNEAIIMKSMLEEAGFEVVIASASVPVFLRGDITLDSELRLGEVKIADYVGFIIPCMSLGNSIVKPEEVGIAKRAVLSGKPVAAQRKGVLILSNAGALGGRRHAYFTDQGIYVEKGVVQDGNIITSAFCPYHGSKDQTAELTQLFIAELQK